MERKRRLKLLNLFDELDCTADYYSVVEEAVIVGVD